MTANKQSNYKFLYIWKMRLYNTGVNESILFNDTFQKIPR